MKKSLSSILVLTLVVTALIGCAPTETPDANKTIIEDVTMRIFCNDGSSSQNTESGKLVEMFFRKMHPNVMIECVSMASYGGLGSEEAEKKFNAEIMTGQGPDLYIFDSFHDNRNLHKTMAAGAYVDLNEFLENDKNFKREDYLEPALKACQIDGKQYLMPFEISTPAYVTTKRTLDETGLDFNSCKTDNDFAKVMLEYFKTRPEQDKRLLLSPQWLHDPPCYNPINYANGTINVDTLTIKSFAELYKLIKSQSNGAGGNYNPEKTADYFNTNHLAVSYWPIGFGVLGDCVMIGQTDMPVLVPTYNSDGDIQAEIYLSGAINSSSKLKQQAYDYLMLQSRGGDIMYNEPEDNEKFDDELKRIIERGYQPTIGLPVYKPYYRYSKDWYTEFYKSVALEEMGGDGVDKLKYVPENIFTEFEDLYNDIDACVLKDVDKAKLMEMLSPYFEGSKTLDECLKFAQDHFEIYISE